MKKIINNILFKIIEYIENYQYRNYEEDQNDPLKKIVNINFTHNEDLYVDTPEGWSQITEINETQRFKIYYIKTNSGKELYCADNHMLYTDEGAIVYVQDLKETDWILTKDGPEFIDEIYSYNSKNTMVDLSVDNEFMNYYGNGILSHNTITAAITLLHYCTFNTNKGCMIVANKGDTVIEIIDKIKNIYKQLPFFLQMGIINWNQKNIVFENGCRIKSQARSKEPAIGFAIDFLYMDEFAHIPPSIIRQYYRAAIPTVSSISGSKIIITSTPNGANLFKELVEGAQLPFGHPDKNMYTLIKVLWWQVPDGKFKDGTLGTRMDPRLYIDDFKMSKYKVKLNEVQDFLTEKGFKHELKSETTDNGEKYYIKILYERGKSEIDTIRTIKYTNNMSLQTIFDITNWKENEVKLIGGEENFNQEYNIQFVTGSNRVLSAQKAKDLDNRVKKYENRQIELLENRLRFPYMDNLRFDPDFIERDRNNYYWFASIDTSEGLGQDDSVLNFFRLMVRSDEWLKNNKIRALHEAFYLKQTFVYSYNKLDPNKELTEIFYLLGFEYLNPDKLKVVLELNSAGTDFKNGLRWVYEGENNFGDYVFVRYKHNQKDKRKKIGLKVTRNKNKLVKSYINSIETDTIYVDEETTISQMESFIKQETRTGSGNYTYKADSGPDDHVMTLVNLSSALDTIDFKNMCQSYFDELPTHTKDLINEALDLTIEGSANFYKTMSKNLNKIKNNRKSVGRFTSGRGSGRFVKR